VNNPSEPTLEIPIPQAPPLFPEGQEKGLDRPVTILIVDDHELVRRGVAAMLASHKGWRVVAETDNGESAMQLVRQYQPDVAIIDMSMPGSMDGLAVTQELAKVSPRTRSLILTMHASKELVREFLQAGAHGYVLKSDAGRYLIEAIEAVLQGKHFFTTTVSEILLDGFLGKHKSFPTEHVLTPREVTILKHLALGCSNKEVATELNISLRTAETHRANIMSKLHVTCVQDLVRYAVKHRLVDL